FTVYCYLDHRDLHSFPTRRSSDLSGEEGDTSRKAIRRAPPTARLRARERDRQAMNPMPASSPRNPPREAATMVAARPSTRQPRQDRKSTRLNSSHVSISYAVFCLK